jgi:glycosyltransferase involved in cell wall biosynthesis
VLAEKMGYAPTCIAKELVRKGVEVHYVTAGLPPNHYMPDFDRTYSAFLSTDFGIGRRRAIDGMTVHYLDYKRTYGGIWMKGVAAKLREIAPDIVQTFAHVGWAPLQAAWLRGELDFSLFTANHMTASVFPLARRNPPLWNPRRIFEFLQRGIPGRFISSQMTACFGATVDCSDVALRFFGVPEHKLRTLPLGVDTSIFHPPADAREQVAARALRQRLGVGNDEIMCVYSGRFSGDKNPLLLARAVAALREAGERYCAIFYGDGEQAEAIAACDGAAIHPFVPYTELGDLFRAADIAIWPTQESTSMLDAAACGTPIVVNDTLAAVERIEGNGLRYRLNDLEDLKRALLDLRSLEERQRLGRNGADKMKSRFAWDKLVQIRLDQYLNF